MTTGRINQISVVLLTILNTSSYSIGQANGDPCSTNAVVSQLTQLCDNRQISHVRVANAFTPAKHLLHWANVPRTDTKTNTFCLPIQTERIHTDLSQNTIQAAIDCDTTNNIKWCIYYYIYLCFKNIYPYPETSESNLSLIQMSLETDNSCHHIRVLSLESYL